MISAMEDFSTELDLTIERILRPPQNPLCEGEIALIRRVLSSAMMDIAGFKGRHKHRKGRYKPKEQAFIDAVDWVCLTYDLHGAPELVEGFQLGWVCDMLSVADPHNPINPESIRDLVKNVARLRGYDIEEGEVDPGLYRTESFSPSVREFCNEHLSRNMPRIMQLL